MRTGRIACVALLAVAAPAALTPGAVSGTAPLQSLCTRGETRLFSCLVGGKLVSICARPDGAIYRYGRPGRVEMRSGDLRFARRGYSGGGEQQIWFASGDYRYVIYDRLVRTSFGADGRHDPQASAGLLIQRAGRTVSDRQCRGGMAAGVDKVVPRGSFVEH